MEHMVYVMSHNSCHIRVSTAFLSSPLTTCSYMGSLKIFGNLHYKRGTTSSLHSKSVRLVRGSLVWLLLLILMVSMQTLLPHTSTGHFMTGLCLPTWCSFLFVKTLSFQVGCQVVSTCLNHLMVYSVQLPLQGWYTTCIRPLHTL